jgi:nucleotide-binding universal stress UspA family protein
VRILVGYVDSPEGRAALNRAIEEAKLRDGELIIVHSMRGGTRDEAGEALHYREELEGVEARLQREGVRGEVRELVLGRSPSEDVVALAADEGADLIVIGLRRRSPVGKLVLGSNAQDILLRAEAPVLAVKAEHGDD